MSTTYRRDEIATLTAPDGRAARLAADLQNRDPRMPDVRGHGLRTLRDLLDLATRAGIQWERDGHPVQVHTSISPRYGEHIDTVHVHVHDGASLGTVTLGSLTDVLPARHEDAVTAAFDALAARIDSALTPPAAAA